MFFFKFIFHVLLSYPVIRYNNFCKNLELYKTQYEYEWNNHEVFSYTISISDLLIFHSKQDWAVPVWRIVQSCCFKINRCYVVKTLNLHIILLCTHLYHFFPVSIHYLQCIHCLLHYVTEYIGIGIIITE